MVIIMNSTLDSSSTLFHHHNDSLLLLVVLGGRSDETVDLLEDHQNVNGSRPVSGGSLAVRVATGFGLYTLALLTCVGNGMVIQAIRTEKRLRKVSNLFIMSLAVADLVVGAFVMPISAFYVLTDRWYLGDWMCEAWLSIDYCASTASIFNLFVLSLDRYWSITSPLKYLRRRTKRRAFLMIAAAWALSLLWILPVTGWSTLAGEKEEPPDHHHQTASPPDHCETDFADNIAFKVSTAVANFYVPTLSMLYIYGRIFCTIRQRSRKDLGEVTTKRLHSVEAPQPTAAAASENVNDSTSLQMTEGCIQQDHQDSPGAAPKEPGIKTKKRRLRAPRWWCCCSAKSVRSTVSSDVAAAAAGSMLETRGPGSSGGGARLMDLYESLTLLELHQVGGDETANGGGGGMTSHYNNVRVNVEYVDGSERSRASHKSQRNGPTTSRGLLKSTSTGGGDHHQRPSVLISLKERKAARQLGVIMCAFIVCWLPYFIVFLVVAGCQECVDDTLFRITLWLGYVNSTLNPVLYPLCNANFRRAFAKMLTTRSSSCCCCCCSRTTPLRHPSQHQTHPLGTPAAGAALPAPHPSRY